MKNAILLDVSAIMYRAYYGNINFRTKNEATGAIYGFINTLTSIIKEFDPDFIAAAFDVKRSSLKRTEIYEKYKSNRDFTPEDLITQIPRIEEVLDIFNIKKYKIEGYEADDVLGSLAKKISAKDVKVTIITGDKDLSQLVDKNICIALLGKGNDGDKFGKLNSSEDVIKYIGVLPEKVPDLFGLIGDSSDGIPGVPKIGSKKALAILEKYDSLEKIYENVDSLKDIDGIGKMLVENIRNNKEIAFLSRELAKIKTDIIDDLEIDDLKYNLDEEKFYEFCKELEFKSFIKKFSLAKNFEDTVSDEKNMKLFDSNFSDSKADFDLSIKDFTVVDSKEILQDKKEFFEKVEGNISIYFSEIGVALSTEQKDFYFPLYHKGLLNKNIEKEYLIDFLSKIDKPFISYNFKNLLKEGFVFKNMLMDVMIAFHLVTLKTKIDPLLPLDHYLNNLENLYDIKTTFPKIDISLLAPEKFGEYLVKISRGLLALYEKLNDDIISNEMTEILQKNEMPLMNVLASMEKNGIKIDKNYFKNYSLELKIQLEKIEEEIYKEAGEIFNLNSPKQLGEILFEKLSLPSGKKTKTGYSTDVSVLEDLEYNGYGIAKHILEYRKLNKLKNTYVDTLPDLADDKLRIHTTFNQIGTVTGRLSSMDPNMQNIPVKTEEGLKIRSGFIAEEGNLLMSIDYSQVELRVLTSLSEDENLISAYRNKKDLHDLTARKIFSMEEDETVSREKRAIAKTINFSIIYGKTPFGLSRELKIPVKDAANYIEKYFEQYPRVVEFEKNIIKIAEQKEYVQTLFGRRRKIDGINSKNKNMKAQAERMAVNTVIQGTAAEIIKKVMLKIYDFLKDKNDIKLLLQVHDELIFEVKEEKIEFYQEILADIMKNTVKLNNVDLEININTGKKWSETK